MFREKNKAYIKYFRSRYTKGVFKNHKGLRLPLIDMKSERKGGLRPGPWKITTFKTQGYRRGDHRADRGRRRTRNLVMKEA